jgi:signal transduction histidine kinase
MFPGLVARARAGVNYRSYKILYVDDEAANLTSFRYCFGDVFDVLTAASADEALALLAHEPVGVLLADQRMPGTTGVELCTVVRERYPDVVRMILTAYADVTAAVAAINSGQVSRYMFKPWREEQMVEVLRAGVEAYELGALTRELQARLLRSEQQATTTFLLGRVLHELANPAATITTNVGWIADTVRGLTQRAKDLPADVAAIIGELDTAAGETALAGRELVQRIERFRRGESPSTPTRGIDLRRAVEAAVALAHAEVRKRARLEMQLVDVAPVAAEAMQVSQIVLNLVMNAVESLDEDKADGNVVTVRLAEDAGQAVLQVSDTGAGIPAELLASIYEPFVSTKSADVARGFGLAVVRDIVRTLGGSIAVDSEVGRGTSFTVRLPFFR